ncbi:putative NRPS-like enzyme [Aaosphaeria arxii CBS 175.79]|uniref:Putative NRPS-like enzyme n=1 Tax=Aaosphaeria arxii CBS 175.79 TaxID=1450172 RepID=A0A6A5XDX7_9PLEO|nr:putative NRPS-like enzyme [Aaosphaeria arxii CBS 175.79]KAF2011090.1 putative NRPS-like enzyme [Aaosphaeria arxii CBS 175.79]
MAEYGRRTLPQALDHHARAVPDRLYASIPKEMNLSNGFQDITCKDMARCTDFIAHWIEARFGQSSSFETIAYLGIPDLRSAAVFLGAVKAGYKVLLPSPRNPPAVNLSLMEQTYCVKLLHTSELLPMINQLKVENSEILTEEIPSFNHILNSEPEDFPFDPHYEEVKDNPIVVLHSSGSTGLPRPITMTHATFAVLDNERKLPTVPGRRNRDFSIWDFKTGGRFYTVFPYFHLAGFLSLLVNPILTEASSPVLGPPLMPPSGELLRSVMQHQEIRALYLPPSIAEQLLREPNGLDFFKNLDFLCYTGGPFSPEAGQQLSRVTELCPLYGSTEAFQVPQLVPAPEDWAWMEWNPHFKLEMQPLPEEKDTFELVLFANESTEHMSALNHNLPGVSEYRTKDLFKQHPQKHSLWQYYGRKDDIVVLSNGGKFNPVPAELLIQSHPAVNGALVVGTGRVQAALLVEINQESGQEDIGRLISVIWPTVGKANQLLPGQGQIMKDKILLSRSTKPFVRAGKGTVVRKLTENLYEAEIDEVYDDSQLNPSFRLPDIQTNAEKGFDMKSVVNFVRDIVVSAFPEMSAVTDNESFFSHGLDSIKINQLVSDFRLALRKSTKEEDLSWITARLIFDHPTIKKLSWQIFEFLRTGHYQPPDHEAARVEDMQELVDRYVAGLSISSQSLAPSRSQRVVAIIGSTGYLGPYILSSLLQTDFVSRVICLNRSHDAKQRTLSAVPILQNQGSTCQISFITADIGKENFGLDDKDYNLLTSTVDEIIFNSWNPNFSIPLASFEQPFLQGLRTVMKWSLSSSRRPRIIYVSSIAAVGNWSKIYPDQPLAPEKPATDSRIAMDMGYGESKNVAEHMLVQVHEKYGVPVAVIRAGQIGGPSDPSLGSWPRQGWLFSLIKASVKIRAFPAKVSPLDWIPVDSFASAIVAIIETKADMAPQVFNMVHPQPEPWSLFLNVLQKQLKLELASMSLSEWLNKLDQSLSPNPENLSGTPKLKIHDFLRTLGEGREDDMRCTINNAKTLVAHVTPLSEDLLAAWLMSWDLGLEDMKTKM